MARKVATPWGRATVIEELELPQNAGDRTFVALVQALEDDAGERLVRFAYSPDGVSRRGPLTLRREDLERLRQGLRDHRLLSRTLGLRPR